MARLVGRSRGCKSCLQRRMKCDEKLPECTQCVSRREKCPGATVGAVFVTMKPKKRKARAKGGGDSNSQRERSISSDETKSDCLGGSPKTAKLASSSGSKLPGAMNTEFLLPTTYQPSKTTLFEQLFLGHFISEFNHQKLQGIPTGSWYDHLPEIFNSTLNQSCKDSIRSTMMVHYGVMTNDRSIQAEAYKWYAKALESQRIFLQKDPLSLIQKMPTSEEALTPVILALFELVTSTTPTGWANHLTGAAAILQMRKAENCQTGLAHLVFRAVRPTMVYVSMATEEPHPFASHPWDTIPFEVHPKTTYDKLVDILLFLPGCLSLHNQIKFIMGLNTTEEQKLRLELELMAFSLLQQLNNWWEEFVQGHARSGRDANSFGQPQPTSMAKEPYFPDDLSAASTAFYHAAKIVLYALLAFCSGAPYAYDAQIELNSSLILASCSYMIANQSPSAGTVMMVFPLKIMCRSSRNELQKKEAFEILGRWGQKKGTLGICTQAAPLYKIPIILASTIGTEVYQ